MKSLEDISREFLKNHKVYRWHLKKVSEIPDKDIVRVCHWYVEDNHLHDEWNDFRDKEEQQ